MTEALYGGIDLLVRFHPAAWPKIFKEFMGTEDYVLRYTISEALGEAYRVNKDNEDEGPRRLGEIRGYCESNDVGYQEVGYYALRYIIAQNPKLLRQNDYIQHLLRLGNFPTYPGRSILGDLLLNIMLQNKGGGSSFGPDEIMTLGGQDRDHRSRFWNPIWRFQRMDIAALIASYHFVGRKSLLDSAAEDVWSAYSILVRTEERRTHLLDLFRQSRSKSMEKVCSLLESYYWLGITPDEQIRADLDGLKDKENRWLKAVFEVLFAHPLWEVIEKAASILASIIDDNPRAVEVVKELFVHDIWRVRYGAAETAFLSSFDRDRELFSNAVTSLYKEDEPLLRGNCAENLAAWILETDVREERAALLNKYQEQIEFWLKDEDCWVLDHIYRLFRKLAQDKQETDFAFLLRSDIPPMLDGEGGLWYQLDRENFLERIEKNKLARTQVDGCTQNVIN